MHALREGAQAFEYPLDVRAVADPSLDIGVPGGNALMAFVDAVMGVSDESPGTARNRLIDELDGPSLFDAATVHGNFQMMNRVAEATGIPIPQQAIDRERETVEALGLDRFLKVH